MLMGDFGHLRAISTSLDRSRCGDGTGGNQRTWRVVGKIRSSFYSAKAFAVILRASSMSVIQRSDAMHNGDVAPGSDHHTAATLAPDHLGPGAVLPHHRWDLRPITLAAKRNRSGQPRRRKFVAMTPRVKKVG
jgi:hypothetical protein